MLRKAASSRFGVCFLGGSALRDVPPGKVRHICQRPLATNGSSCDLEAALMQLSGGTPLAAAGPSRLSQAEKVDNRLIADCWRKRHSQGHFVDSKIWDFESSLHSFCDIVTIQFDHLTAPQDNLKIRGRCNSYNPTASKPSAACCGKIRARVSSLNVLRCGIGSNSSVRHCFRLNAAPGNPREGAGAGAGAGHKAGKRHKVEGN